MIELKKEIQEYWNSFPQGTLRVKDAEPCSKEFFLAYQLHRYQVEPHIPRIAEFRNYKGRKVLEVGCGVGIDLMQFAKWNAEVVGIDISKRSVACARKGLRLFKLAGETVVADAENLPFRDGAFDHVYSYGVLHHTPNTENAINEIHRVLKNEGTFTIMLYAKWSVTFLYILLKFGLLKLELLHKSIDKLISDHMEDAGYTPLAKLYTKKRITKMFKNFKILSMKKLHIPKKYPILARVLSPLQRVLGFYFIIKGLKVKATS
jgi:ubiquinone/menaquinone biosynthesis C-methylase UbiE